MVSCNYLHGINNAAHLCSPGASTASDQEGTPLSYRVKVHDYDTSISDNTMFIESACFTNVGVAGTVVNLGTKLPYGKNNDSPFKISITGYPTDNCLPGGGPGIDKFEVMYLHGIGQNPVFYDLARDGTGKLFNNPAVVYQYLALNEYGAGTPFWNEMPYFNCYEGVVPVDCVQNLSSTGMRDKFTMLIVFRDMVILKLM